MKKYAILLGSAPEDFRQKKLEGMFDFLDSKRNKGDSIVTFANGISELMLEIVMENSIRQNPDSILLYICTLHPISDDEKSVWLGGEEIRHDVISHYQMIAAECGIDFQVIFDSDSELVSEEVLGYEKISEKITVNSKQENLRSSAESAGDFSGGAR